MDRQPQQRGSRSGSASPALSMALECAICLTLPADEVHQCHNSHCYCVDCWNKLLDPRRCPECRDPLPQMNRNRDREERIAALPAQCDHCGEATTHGNKPAHERACPQRPVKCMGAAAGCSWAGVAAEQQAHEAICPRAGCQRLLAPLQVLCDGLLAQNRLQTVLNQQLITQNDQWQQQVAALQWQVAGLEPLVGRVRVLEGNEEADVRQQRQRIGPAPHDAPPHDAAVAVMEPAELVAALQAHGAVARVAATACNRLAALSFEEGSHSGTTVQLAVEAGALEAVVGAMRAHLHAADVQGEACCALTNLCIGIDAAGLARLQRAAEAGALEAVVEAMWAHPQVTAVQERGCGPLSMICWGEDALGLARKQRAVDAGALQAVVTAMQTDLQAVYVQEDGCYALNAMCAGSGAAAVARRQLAIQVGACAAATAARMAHPDDSRLHEAGRSLQRLLGVFG